MNPYYRVACVGYSPADTKRFTTRGAQQRRLVRYVPVSDINELKAIAPRRRFDAVLISSPDFACCPAGALALKSKYDTRLPVFVNGLRSPKTRDSGEIESAIYISFHETPVESAAFRLCSESLSWPKRVIDPIQESDQSLNRQLLSMNQILDSCADAIIVTDHLGNVNFANSGSEWLFDRSANELIGKKISFLSQESSVADYVLEHPSGVNLNIEISSSQVIQAGQPVYIHTVRDVTDRISRQNAEISIEISRSQIEKWQSLETLAAGMSHQFNNLLMIILGHCGKMKGKAIVDDDLMASILQIEKSSSRAADITSHLLTFAGLGKYEFSEVSVSDMIDKLHSLLDAIAFRRAIIEYNLDSSVPKIWGDGSQLQRLLFDVVNNSLEAFQNEKGVISITTGWIDLEANQIPDGTLTDELPAGKYAYIQISDTGCGMDEETTRQIFQPFYTTKGSKRGLGLSAALGIVRGHHGAIGVHSKTGRGTTMEIFLPVANVVAKQEVAAINDGGSRLPQMHPLRLLIAEDEGDLREVLGEYLSASGCSVIAAEDGKACVEKYQENAGNFDCIILDMSMPNMDGEETIEALRGLGAEVPVIVTSGFTDSATISRLKKAGVAFLQKPYQLTVLEDLMKREIVANLTRHPQFSN